MARFHRSRLDRIEQRLRPVDREYLDTSSLDPLISACRNPDGSRNRAAECDLINEARKIFGFSSNKDVLKFFFDFWRKQRQRGKPRGG